MNIRIYNYNNYYNRLVKIMDTTSPEYSDYTYELLNTNFNPNDEIHTEHVFGSKMDYYEGNGDYLICIQDGKIVSRWFILENVRTKGGQWKVSLKRDTIADFYNIVMNAPCFVEKGYVDNSSVLIYNNENMSFNQIKQKEYLLENNIKSPWLVAYLSRWHTEPVDPDNPGGDTVQSYNRFKGEFVEDTDLTPDYVFDSLDEYIYKKYTSNNPYKYTEDITFAVNYQKNSDYLSQGNTAPDRVWGVTKDGYYNSTLNANAISSSLPRYIQSYNPDYLDETVRQSVYDSLYEKYTTYNTVDADTALQINTVTNLGTFEGYLTLSKESNKVIQVGTKFYRIISHITSTGYSVDNEIRLENFIGSFGEFVFNQLVPDDGLWIVPNDALKAPFIRLPYQNPSIYFTIEEFNRKKVTYDFTYSSNVTVQTPYEIIAAPLYSCTIEKDNETIYHNGDVALSWFLDLGEKNASGLVYDIQIVPYCCVDTLDWSNYNIVKCYKEDDVTSELAWAVKVPYASFNHTYSIDIPVDTNYKVAINCDLYRFCSPNGIGNFDFNPAKNNGMSGFEVDCTLLPYNPYIKVNPIFNQEGLYGGDYNDYRGLICGGDFSLPITTNQWETYQVNNKYYQQIFNRQIDNLEINNNWARAEAIVQSLAGTLSGAAAGGFAGSMVPGIGTAAGAIAGGVASLGAGVADVIKTFQLTEEKMSFMQDNYAYSLQTIQAKPNTITRTSAYNINNKYFPYIEYFSCKEEEKTIFKNKLKYDGMTIMAIGKLNDYIGPEETFIKGKIIRIPDLEEDYHTANDIVLEISKGVYV